MNILINGVGGPTPRSIARTIRQYCQFENVKLIGTDINPVAYGLYEDDLYDQTYLVPPAGHPDYWPAIEEIIEKHNISLALVHPEQEVMAWSKRMEDDKTPCKVMLPSHSMSELLVDKSKKTEVLKDSGLVPESYVFNADIKRFEDLEATLTYPFWIRATSGSSGLGSLKVENRDALTHWLHINPSVKHFIASTFLPGRNLAVKLLYHKGKLLRSASGERVSYIMSKVAPSGITGNTSFGRLLNESGLVEQAVKAMELLFEYTGSEKHGFFTADFKEDETGHPYITEINVRMVAFNLSFAAGGANFTEDIIRLLSEDSSFDRTYKMYEFEPGTIFLRDVDAEPKLMNEKDLKT
jgi:carbamoyl-phosphate synthase large subunit